MTAISLSNRSDNELLGFTRTVLSEQGFQVETLNQEVDLLLAENSYFVVAVAAMNTIQNLILAEPLVSEALSRRLGTVPLGPKKWDTYLVLLTQEKSTEDDASTRDLYAINHDTSRVRRIAHTGVDPTLDAARQALSPFIEPMSPTTPVAVNNALESLLQTLIAHGVGQDFAQRAVTAFEQGASLDDVL